VTTLPGRVDRDSRGTMAGGALMHFSANKAGHTRIWTLRFSNKI
jgi:hypothetical protein